MTDVKLGGCGSRMRGVLFVLGLLFALATSETRAVVLENGIDPANLGKGDWIYILSNATSQHGGLDGLMAYEKSQGVNYLILKAGDGSDLYPSSASPQFASNVVDSAHAAGLKIFGYTRSFGTNIPGELAIITNAISLGADGYVIDAEQEWESQILPNNDTAALQLLQPIKAAFPNRFLGYSPQMYIHFHSTFPYSKFGIYSDAAMPQAYWKSFDITPTQCLSDLATEWQNWQNSLTGTNRNAIKPIAPVAQGYTPGTDPVTAAEITEFCNFAKIGASPITAGIKSINYFRSELHATEMWDAIRTNSIGDKQPVAPFVYRVQATNITDTSATITWVSDSNADSIVDYGRGPAYSNSSSNSILSTSHTMIISGLTQTNLYHFRVRSKLGSSTNVTYSGDFTFTTRIAGFVPDIILDNTNAAVVGTWTTGTSSTDRYGADYRSRGVGTGANFLVYNPSITQAGLYQIFETHPQGSNRSTNTPHIVTFFGGVATNFVNQAVGGGVVGGKFNSLTTVYFQAGTNGSVKITDAFTSTNGLQVMADAIKFVYVGQPAPPNITAQPIGTTVSPGSSVTFAAAASGLAPLAYQWQLNGDNIPGATNATHVRANVQVADAGTYTVVASNPGGSTESIDAILNVTAAPSITGQPVSLVVNPGDPASFTVAASGSPAPTFQWWFAGAPIADATDSTFALTSAQSNQAGNYWVVASNAAGSVTSSIVSLTVTTPPAIAAQPISQIVTNGDNVIFSVVAIGTVPLSYQWTFNGASIFGATNSSLPIVNAQANNAGTYAVVVSNVAGSVTSSNASLTVNIPAGFVADIIVDNTNATVVGAWSTNATATDRFGADYRFRTVGTGANSLLYKPTIIQAGLYQIFETHPQGSNRSTNTPHIITFSGGVLTNFVNQAVGGGVAGGKFNPLTTVYFQAGTNGSVKISDASPIANGLQVMADAIKFVYVGQPAPPTITSQPLGGTVNPGTNVVFTVTASGTAPLTYQWQFNGNNIPGATNATYVRSNVQLADAGTYTVLVSNPGGSTQSADAVLNLNAAPSITGQPVSLVVNPGDPASFTVAADGSPAATFQWWFAGAPIADATDSTFALASAQPNQSGNYWVVASNAAGSVTSSIVSLTVNIPAGIAQQPVSQSVTLGGNATFSVTATGTAPLGYQWTFNGAPIIGASASSYTILNAQTNKAGSYAVVVSNVAGTVTSSTVSLTVNIPAGIAQQPVSQSVTLGGNATFSVTATGTAPLGYQWSFNGAPIFGATDSSYTILNAQTNNAGSYAVLVSNVAGTVTSSTVSLAVNIPPSIDLPPVSQSVTIGSNAVFSVTATGTAPMGYQWIFDGAPISSATDSSYSVLNAQTNNAGSYAVVVSNVAGSVTSSIVSLTVNIPPDISQQPVSQTVTMGGNTTFSVAATGAPAPTFQWWFAGAPIATATDSTNMLVNVQPNQAGDYWVVASNVAGSVTSSIVSLIVNIPAGIAQQPISQSVTLGGNATFSVTATGTAPLGYQWTFNGLPIAGATDSSLTMVNVQTDNAGSYAVVVSNVAGSVTSSIASLAVNIPPSITQQPISHGVTIGSNATFSVTATGTAPLGYQWSFNGAPIFGATDSSYTIVNAQTNNAGSYAVLVSNVAGTVTSSTVSLAVNIPPSIDLPPVSQSVTIGSNAVFSVTATGTAPMGYQWIFDGAPISSATDSSYSVLNAQTNNAGSYAVVVANVAGSVTSSIVSLTINIPPSITQEPVSQIVTVGNNATFTVAADGSPAPTFQWWFAGAPIADATQSSFALANAQPNQAGEYWLVASNVAGSVTSSIVSLTVNIPAGIDQQPISQSVTIGGNATFSVTATGTAPLNYQWSFNGLPIPGATDSSYSVLNAQTSNAGSYAVVVSNVAGSVVSSIVSLAVNIPPSITQQPVSQTIIKGSTATFSVTTTGTAPMGYQWRFNGLPIAGATDSSYSVLNAQTTNAGSYAVVVSNVAGSVTSSTVSLVVNVPPSITQQPISQAVIINGDVTFSVTATGTALMGYQWSFNGSPIPGATASSYTVSKVKKKDTGSYSVVISNVAGSITSANAELTIAKKNQADVQMMSVLPDTRVHLTIAGTPGVTYMIEGSSDLVKWVELGAVVSTNGTIDLSDTAASNPSVNFFRTRQMAEPATEAK
ncbi:beta strand repeat-containing protein [Pedosphaera parvula]|uniref:Conserved repeat domain protein n=1 Tax=Pedosphaera parvula (strain Ellin514) TaxID=320771 RepID=B9XI67_PEDPL|nr:immunoglobulin domain-containing protein [Pedosphaera parvula]EEF60560.1 conserved repeat domain protein [Pedosphaera parvula Ellin514]